MMPNNVISRAAETRTGMRTVLTIALCADLSLLAGCASRERVYGAIYEGLRTREAIVRPSTAQRPPERTISYQEYEAERKKLLENKNHKLWPD
jgi:type IV pilus biogenesis protein CpaD/CtpE